MLPIAIKCELLARNGPKNVARNHGLGRLGNRSPGITTRAARSWLHVLRRKWRGRKRGPEAENRQGRSAERRGVPIARDAGALRKRPGVPRYGAPTGASQAPGAC